MNVEKEPQHAPKNDESTQQSDLSDSDMGDDDDLLYYPQTLPHLPHSPSPFSSFSSPSPFQSCFSRQRSLARYEDLPMEKFESASSALSLFFFIINHTAPLAYTYIVLCVLRDVLAKTDTLGFVNTNLPFVRWVLKRIVDDNPMFLHVLAILEAIFHIFFTIQMHWLQNMDPLELSLQSAQIMEIEERSLHWERILESERHNPVGFLTDWFFGCELESIDRSDAVDFVSWSMFEGRNVEHLTGEEVEQLDEFVQDLEYCLSLYLYGHGNDANEDEKKDDFCPSSRQRPEKLFRFIDHIELDAPHWAFFSNLYENYKNVSENYLNFHVLPSNAKVQDVRRTITQNTQSIVKGAQKNFEGAEKYLENSAANAASHIRENATNMYENAYFSIIDKGSAVDKRINVFTHTTASQLTDAWNSGIGMKVRLETAQFVTKRSQHLRGQLKNYQALLSKMSSMSGAVPSLEMANTMKKITKIYEAMGELEFFSRDDFIKVSGYAKNFLPKKKTPLRYAKYSFDPIMGVTAYPLSFHLLMLSITEGGLRILMRRRGFERRTVGQLAYFYHPGTKKDQNGTFEYLSNDEDESIPVVFCHGIGIGLIMYIDLIDKILALGRPIFLPEIPYVTGFRAWTSSSSVLTPNAVASNLKAMIAVNGFLKASWMGHSFGTSWLSYLCKLAPQIMECVVFIDPICFKLHDPYLAKQFVYHQANRGSPSFMIRTDMMVNWTIQRGFPWARISLFLEEIPCKCAVFLSEEDALVPAKKVEDYFRRNRVSVRDYNIDISWQEGYEKDRTLGESPSEPNSFNESDNVKTAAFENDFHVTVFRGDGHGDWTEGVSAERAIIVGAVEVLGLSSIKLPSR